MNGQIARVALAAAALAGCSQDRGITGAAASRAGFTASAVAGSEAPGAVYALSNSPAGNAVLVYDRGGDGSLTPAGSYATGGMGSGAGPRRSASATTAGS